MKILLFNTFYYPKLVGGAEISVQILAEQLAHAGHQVFLVTFGEVQNVSKLNGVVLIRITQKNIFFHYRASSKNKLSKIGWHLIDSCNPFYYFFIKKIINRIKPDVVHTHNIQGFSPLIWYFIKKQHVPLVHTMRDYYLLCQRCNLFNSGQNCSTLCKDCSITHRIKKNFLKHPDLVVGVSQFIVNKHEHYLPALKNKKTTHVYNPILLPETVASVTQSQSVNEKIRFGFIGRLSADKGVEYLINELLSLPSDLIQQITITFAGKGEPNYVEAFSKRLAEKRVAYTFLGVVKPEIFYEQVDVSVVPSLWHEPFGRVVIESLAHGVPVCMSDSGGLKEIHDQASTWLFQTKPGHLASLIEKIVLDQDELLSKKRHSKAYSHQFLKERHSNEYLKIYHRTIKMR